MMSKTKKENVTVKTTNDKASTTKKEKDLTKQYAEAKKMAMACKPTVPITKEILEKKAKRRGVKKSDATQAGSDAFGCKIGEATNLANAIMYRLTVDNGHYTNAEVENAMREILKREQVRPSSPHSSHFAELGYAEQIEGEHGKWRLTANAVKLAEYCAKNGLCDRADLLAAECKK